MLTVSDVMLTAFVASYDGGWLAQGPPQTLAPLRSRFCRDSWYATAPAPDNTKPLNQSSTKLVLVIMFGVCTIMQLFIQIGQTVSVLTSRTPRANRSAIFRFFFKYNIFFNQCLWFGVLVNFSASIFKFRSYIQCIGTKLVNCITP